LRSEFTTSGTSVYRHRAKILVSLFPGIHLRELQRSLGISFNTTRYHVDALSKSGEIEREDDSGYSRLYPTGISPGDKVLFSSCRSSTRRTILSMLTKKGELSNKELSELSGLAKSTISEQIRSLTENGIVQLTGSPDTRGTFSLKDPFSVSRVLERSQRTLLESASERFIDLWDF
jgi:predicted transcriptional regulator